MRPLLCHCLQAVGRSEEKIAIKSGVFLRECDRVVTKVTIAEVRVLDMGIAHFRECKLPSCQLLFCNGILYLFFGAKCSSYEGYRNEKLCLSKVSRE